MEFSKVRDQTATHSPEIFTIVQPLQNFLHAYAGIKYQYIFSTSKNKAITRA
jgi:hypothetical protein